MQRGTFMRLRKRHKFRIIIAYLLVVYFGIYLFSMLLVELCQTEVATVDDKSGFFLKKLPLGRFQCFPDDNVANDERYYSVPSKRALLN